MTAHWPRRRTFGITNAVNGAPVTQVTGGRQGWDITNVDISSTLVTLTKTASATGSVIDDTFTYTINISNTGLVSASSTVLTDTISAGATFVPGSVIVAGTAQPTANPATVEPGQSLTLIYQVTVAQTPPSGYIVNQATLSYSFTLPEGRSVSGSLATNAISTPVVSTA